jgi:CBS domain-containing protein
MNDKVYTHVPVIENNKMVGVFSENTILSYLVHHKDAIIMKDTKIEEFKDFILIDKHTSEHFIFVPKDALLIEVEAIFHKGLVNRKRIAVVYITENGKPEEGLLGMITAWDIAGK